jgi:hypothetical protein
MAQKGPFSEDDLKQLKTLGISLEQAIWQLSVLEKGPHYLSIVGPCTLGNGILALEKDKASALARLFEDAASQLEIIKFVPASGAASRMFKALMAWKDKAEDQDFLERQAKKGDESALDVKEFLENINKFPFWDDIVKAAEQQGFNAESLFEKKSFGVLISLVLDDKGLFFSNMPKGLIPFHLYDDGPRTAVVEHLVEAILYAKGRQNCCRLHFTVDRQKSAVFQSHAKEGAKALEKKQNVKFVLDFSEQNPSTNTLAVTPEKKLFRLADGSLFFRPGGHGALLENLSKMDADLIFINNIDNVVRDQDKEERAFFKKVLAGFLLEVQKNIFNFIEKLDTIDPDDMVLKKASAFATQTLNLDVQNRSGNDLRLFLLKKFNRPLRVCGMVKNQGDPGGAPFWVRGTDKSISIQIVEGAQINQNFATQKNLFLSSTHFNPVDIVCAFKDRFGNPFNLKDFVDEKAVFISEKSKDGAKLLALELPGLWNGSMAFWNSIFIDIPMVAYNPVKKITDLLKPSHFH